LFEHKAFPEQCVPMGTFSSTAASMISSSSRIGFHALMCKRDPTYGLTFNDLCS